MQNAHFISAAIDDLIASFGRPLPVCPNCNSRMVMSCREAWRSEPLIFTFECRSCRLVMQRAKAPAFSTGEAAHRTLGGSSPVHTRSSNLAE